MKNKEQLEELAALHSLGALDGADAEAFDHRLANDAQARRAVAEFDGVTEALAKAFPAAPNPSANLKERILQAAERSRARRAASSQLKSLLPATGAEGFAFVKGAADSAWLPLPVAGAFVKLLSFDDSSSHAVVLGKLEAGASYPGHTHTHSEDIWMLTGDLHVNDQVLRGGDFHHAGAGSTHGVNWSKDGCLLLAVLSKEDLLAQLVKV